MRFLKYNSHLESYAMSKKFLRRGRLFSSEALYNLDFFTIHHTRTINHTFHVGFWLSSPDPLRKELPNTSSDIPPCPSIADQFWHPARISDGAIELLRTMRHLTLRSISQDQPRGQLSSWSRRTILGVSLGRAYCWLWNGNHPWCL